MNKRNDKKELPHKKVLIIFNLIKKSLSSLCGEIMVAFHGRNTKEGNQRRKWNKIRFDWERQVHLCASAVKTTKWNSSYRSLHWYRPWQVNWKFPPIQNSQFACPGVYSIVFTKVDFCVEIMLVVACYFTPYTLIITTTTTMTRIRFR